MKKLKIALAAIVMVLGVAAFFAFKAEKQSPEQSYTWIRYDCNSAEPVVLTVSSGTNYQMSKDLEFTGNFENCDGNGNLCAVRFLTTEVQDYPGHPGNKRPIGNPSLDGRLKAYCN